mgnify:FL=1
MGKEITEEFNFQVENFIYNGFMVIPKKGFANYKAKFLQWTSDPGVAKCECSDGELRLIPSCCLIGDSLTLPIQEKTNLIFGQPSKS